MSAPLHRHEVHIHIGANTSDYVIEVLREILRSFDEAKNIGNSCSGGWQGSYAVTSAFREITPDDYRAELALWFQQLGGEKTGAGS